MSLLIGIELELLIRPKPAFASQIPGFILDDPHPLTRQEIRSNRLNLHKMVANHLTENAQQTILDSENAKYEKWISISEAQPFGGFCTRPVHIPAHGFANFSSERSD